MVGRSVELERLFLSCAHRKKMGFSVHEFGRLDQLLSQLKVRLQHKRYCSTLRNPIDVRRVICALIQ